MLKKILFGGESGLSPFANIGLAALRIFAGIAMMFGHGLGKIPPSGRFIEVTAKLGFPLPTVFAWSAGLSEFVGGGLLALGLFTRISSFFIAFTMVVAVFVANAGESFGEQEKGLLYLFIALLFLFKGGGDWSIDYLVRKK
jgi:putative oxidoreductase